jgi:hypothetical protein
VSLDLADGRHYGVLGVECGYDAWDETNLKVDGEGACLEGTENHL